MKFGVQADLIQQPNFNGMLDPLLGLMMTQNNILDQPAEATQLENFG